MIRCIVIINLLLFFGNNTCAIAQKQDRLFTKSYGLKSNVATKSYYILTDEKQNILVANLFGIDHFDGVRWRRYRISEDYTKIPEYLILVKNNYNQGSFILGGSRKCGILRKKQGSLVMDEIITEKENRGVLGDFLYKVIQYDNRTFFIGRSSGVIIYNHQTHKKQTITKVNLKSRPYYLFIDNQILLHDGSKDIFILGNKAWKKTDKYPIIKRFSPQCIFKVDQQNTLLVSQSGEVYLQIGKQEFQKIEVISEKLVGGFFTRIKKQGDKLYICNNNKLLIYSLKTKKVLYYRHFKQIFF